MPVNDYDIGVSRISENYYVSVRPKKDMRKLFFLVGFKEKEIAERYKEFFQKKFTDKQIESLKKWSSKFKGRNINNKIKEMSFKKGWKA